ncbi:MAG: hypothetical protein ACRCYZ_00430 [Alphaproteobacteria bacterium]
MGLEEKFSKPLSPSLAHLHAEEFDLRHYAYQDTTYVQKTELPHFMNEKNRNSEKFLKPELRDTFIAYQLQKQFGKKADGLSASEKKQLFLIRSIVPQELKEFLTRGKVSSYIFSTFFDPWLESRTSKQRYKLGRAASYLGMKKINFRGNKWKSLKNLSSLEKEHLVEVFLFDKSRGNVRRWIQKGMPISPVQTLAELFPEEASDKSVLQKWFVINRGEKTSPERGFDFFVTQRPYKAPGKRALDHGRRRVVADSIILSSKLPDASLEDTLAAGWILNGFSANYISANSSGNCALVRWINPRSYTAQFSKMWGERVIVVIAFVNEERALEPCQLEHLKFITQGGKNISIAYLGSEEELENELPENEISNILEIRDKLQLAPLPLNPEVALTPLLTQMQGKQPSPVSRHRIRHANSRHQPPIF